LDGERRVAPRATAALARPCLAAVCVVRDLVCSSLDALGQLAAPEVAADQLAVAELLDERDRDRIRASITRADIASFLLDQTTDARFQRAAPAISN
jgi:hypothetical protein